MDAIILAGTSDKGLQEFGINKSLVKYNGSSLLSIIANALSQAERIDRIFLITDIELSEITDIKDTIDYFLKPTGDIIDSVVNCIKAYGIKGSFLTVASDLPFVTGEAVNDFISKCDTNAHLNYCIVSKHSFKKAYPGYKKSFFRLRDGVFTGGSMFIADAQALVGNTELPKSYFANRKSSLKLIGLIGISGVLRYLCGWLSIIEIQNVFQIRTGCKLKAVESEFPQIVLDIDRKEQLYVLEDFNNNID